MSLDHWDRNIRPHLAAIHINSLIALRHARMLNERANFETLAEDQLATLRRELTSALENVVMAQATYQGKPLETS